MYVLYVYIYILYVYRYIDRGVVPAKAPTYSAGWRAASEEGISAQAATTNKPTTEAAAGPATMFRCVSTQSAVPRQTTGMRLPESEFFRRRRRRPTRAARKRNC
jgi:hypothetical protein